MRQGVPDDLFAEPHYLDGLRIQRLSDGAPLLVVDTSSVSAGDGDQVRLTQALAYRRDKDQRACVGVAGEPRRWGSPDTASCASTSNKQAATIIRTPASSRLGR